MAIFSLFWAAMVALVNMGIIQFIQEKVIVISSPCWTLLCLFLMTKAEIREFGAATMCDRPGPQY